MIFAGRDATLWAAAGGAIIAVGAWLNGRCAMGTIAGLGSGDLCRVGTILGYLFGASVAHGVVPALPAGPAISPLAILPSAAVAVGALSVAAVAIWLIRRSPPEKGVWPLDRSMPLIGLVNGGLMLASAGWAWTALVGDVAMGHWMGTAGRAGLFIVLVAGAVAGGFASGSFAIRRGTARQWALALAGGALMGLGTIIVPGGNDTMLMIGLPLLIPNLVMGYAVLYAMLFLLVRIEDFSKSHR